MKKYLIAVVAICMTAGLLKAQNATEALYYSNLNIGGTARFVGVGGSLGAMGSDFSVVSTNPAGIGQIRQTQMTFSPNLSLANGSSLLLNGGNNSSVSESATGFNIDNIGLVIALQPSNKTWTTSNVTIGMNRMASYKQLYRFKGFSKGSITDRFVELANAEEFGIETDLALDGEAIFLSSGKYTSDFEQNPDAIIEREQRVDIAGAMDEVLFGWSGTLQNKLSLGATLGVAVSKHEQTKTYTEDDVNEEVPLFQNLKYTEYLLTRGLGLQFKFGMIYKINKMFRAGLAFHTPMSMALTDEEYNLSLDYQFENNANPVSDTKNAAVSNYGVKTPFRIIVSGGALIARKGFINAELEMVDYRKNKFSEDEDTAADGDAAYLQTLNDSIAVNFNSALNFRVGGEFKLNNKYRIRGGIRANGTPYASNTGYNMTYSGGLGYNQEGYFIDLGYSYSQRNEGYRPYQTTDAYYTQIVDNTFRNSKIVMTVGLRF